MISGDLSLRRVSERRIDEAAELFGPPPPKDEQHLALIALLFSDWMKTDPLRASQKGYPVAHEHEEDCYSAAIVAALNMPREGYDLDELVRFFHLAAAFGEARLLGQIMTAINVRAALDMKPQGNA